MDPNVEASIKKSAANTTINNTTASVLCAQSPSVVSTKADASVVGGANDGVDWKATAANSGAVLVVRAASPARVANPESGRVRGEACFGACKIFDFVVECVQCLYTCVQCLCTCIACCDDD